ncbi:hypothetical protein BCR44DRAFT_36568 [Catenaria anguillulae PL171]|uniref:Uncharacterized protein n=1 Tax=Catenaria anguillulae PL171 TaxID=765915 RepID=A0A1Y2I1H6_9FUNG|nr:hypothetical protein BCR44DRAFT_36568 [Catenaria anguillulae PL171]
MHRQPHSTPLATPPLPSTLSPSTPTSRCTYTHRVRPAREKLYRDLIAAMPKVSQLGAGECVWLVAEVSLLTHVINETDAQGALSRIHQRVIRRPRMASYRWRIMMAELSESARARGFQILPRFSVSTIPTASNPSIAQPVGPNSNRMNRIRSRGNPLPPTQRT